MQAMRPGQKEIKVGLVRNIGVCGIPFVRKNQIRSWFWFCGGRK